MDYINYELDKYYKQQEKAENMAELGFDTEDEYYDYLADLKADAQLAHWEAMQELNY